MPFYQEPENLCDCCREPAYEEIACRAHGCGNDVICPGCTFTCADCSRDFCGEHIVDLADQEDRLGTHFSVYLCAPCHLDRQAERVEAACAKHQQTERALRQPEAA